MKKIILGVFFFLQLALGYSQQQKDTIYFNEYWYTSSKEKASFFRPLPLEQKDSLFLIKDYYINGVLQMEGWVSNVESEVFSGTTTYYFPNGNPQKIVERNINNSADSRVKMFLEDGRLKTIMMYRNGDPYEGTRLEPGYAKFKRFKIENYQQGMHTTNMLYYESNNKVVAELDSLSSDKKIKNTSFFNLKEKLLGKVFYKKIYNRYRPYKGKKATFTFSKNHLVESIQFIKEYTELDSIFLEVKVYSSENRLLATGIRNMKTNERKEGVFYEGNYVYTYKNYKLVKEMFDHISLFTRGEYKDGVKYHGTFYDDSRSKFSSYKDGKLHGVQKIFDSDFKTKVLENYNNGVREGLNISYNKATDTQYECVYKQGEPFSGAVYSFGMISVYENGKEVKRHDLDNKDTHIIETSYLNESVGYTRKDYFKDGKTYTLYFKNGRAFKGEQIDEYGFRTFKDGALNGPFSEPEGAFLINGNNKADKKEGRITFVNKKTKETAYCTYRNGEPIDGTIISVFGTVNYKNGLKHGLEIVKSDYEFPYNSYKMYFDNGEPVGEISYFLNDEFVYKGTYKNHLPYQGVFHKERSIFEVYEKGVRTEHHLYHKEYEVIDFYEKEVLVSQEVREIKTNSLVHHLKCKNGKPYTGTQFFRDSSWPKYQLIPFEKGKKQGTVLSFNNIWSKNEVPYFEANYKSGKLEGITKFKYEGIKDSIGVYKKNVPYTGAFIFLRDKSNAFVQHYLKGELIKEDSYKKNYAISDFALCNTIEYKGETPYQGTIEKRSEEYTILKSYHQGKQETTKIYSVRQKNFSEQPYWEVEHSTLQDRVFPVKIGRLPSATISYKNEEKRTGEIKYYKDTTAIGLLQFKDNRIIKMNVAFDDNGYWVSTTLTNKNKMEFWVKKDGVTSIFTPFETVAKITNILETLLLYIPFSSGFSDGIMKYYLDGHNKVFASVIFKNKKPFEGSIFVLNKKGTYNFAILKNGKQITKIENLTKEELLAKLKTLETKK